MTDDFKPGEVFLSVNGTRANSLRGHIPYSGVWFVNVDFDTVVTLSGKVTVAVGPLAMVGTIDPTFSGDFQLRSRYRIVGGAMGWRKIVPAKHFHNDAGVKASTVANYVSGKAGETLVIQDGVDYRLPFDFASGTARASSTMDLLFDVWFVGFDGKTQVASAPRATAEITGAYDLLDFDPRQKTATVAVDDPTRIQIGTILRGRLSQPRIVRGIELEISKGSMRQYCWAPLEVAA